jgi:Zn finger protein HypA/HybF involved in hydrogenase expression
MKETNQYCKCSNCNEVFLDTNGGQQPEFETPFDKNFRHTTTQLEFSTDEDEDNEYFIGCPTCQTDGFLMDVEEEIDLL